MSRKLSKEKERKFSIVSFPLFLLAKKSTQMYSTVPPHSLPEHFSPRPQPFPFPDSKELRILFPFPQTFSSNKQALIDLQIHHLKTLKHDIKIKNENMFTRFINVDLSLSSELPDLSRTTMKKREWERQRG